MYKTRSLIIFIFLFIGTQVVSQTDTTRLIRSLTKVNEKKHAQIYCKLAEAAMRVNIDQAIDYAKIANNKATEFDNEACLIHSLDLLANLHLMNGNLRKAFNYYEDELKILAEVKDSLGIALVNYNLGKAYYLDSKERKAEKYFVESMKIAEKLGVVHLSLKNYEILFALNYNKKKYKEALTYFKSYIKIKDSSMLKRQKRNYDVLMREFVYAIDTAEKHIEQKEQAIKRKDSAISVVTMERDTLQVVTDAQGKEIEQLNYEKAYQNEVIQRQEMQRNFLILMSLLVLALFFLMYNRYKLKKRSNTKLLLKNNMILQQKEEIEAQRDNLKELNNELEQQKEEIEAQRDKLKELNNELEQQKEEVIAQRDELQDKKYIIERKNENITSSIRYAKRIQSAALPSIKLFDDYFDDYFIFFKPRDIVSGDFYWMKKVGNRIFVTVADCTGHGVPGAFVSMLGISMLNEITSRDPNCEASTVLNRLRELIKKSLNQSATSESKDGMDMALCIIEQDTKTIHFSGANNPLFLIRDGVLQVYKSTRNPVSVYLKEKDFENHILKYESNDMIYMFSDGFPDQFGGSNAAKFKITKFKTMLTKNAGESCNYQNEVLGKTLEDWMSTEEQIDDVTVLGIRL